ncbi:MAG: Na(+)-translocating NADH-quinone reductase subunit C [Gammaproteobacteria bacterium]|jgi:Na+-transporting NADH:ubiquinone oxidoreductase subunit C|nr:Na(+)-translocating NADH-quinone reductase subunit C [Gammaproteobacteria bacterium]MBT4494369.1 Na(+)-translocating NADH-quinone reductase subunit C [Gammaproteobacteria bacterium]MBT7372199.1 Na(+)-translocating NADH-quinone reductase subunit C [Gammaproteobacteria bacterium]
MKNIIVVSLLVCLVCSIVVSSAAVILKPQRLANKELDRNKNILEAAGLYEKATATGDEDIPGLFENFEIRLVDLEEKRVLSVLEASDLGIDPTTYDQRKAAKNPALSKVLSSAEDIPSISRRARYSTIYILRDGQNVDKVVLPVHGYGLWSTLYGFIALDGDMSTVSGITFYEHGETAGLGGEVDNPSWKAVWAGKTMYEGGEVVLKVLKGAVNPNAAGVRYQVDGLSGATLTSRGIQNIVTYWMGDQGFGPILKEIQG